ncbi:hypothetical protein MYX64_09165 [Nitrospinae bacterium AH_259_B05_G02_I21]|nr:hypothetical protein [Nitrospinae bacterium AH_259_B05_G02_I21]
MVAGQKSSVKQQLEKRGIQNKEIAEDLKVHPSLISQVVNFKKRSLRVQLYIALRLGKHYEELWGRAA